MHQVLIRPKRLFFLFARDLDATKMKLRGDVKKLKSKVDEGFIDLKISLFHL